MILREIAAVRRIPSVRATLELLCEATGCRIAVVARMTESTWHACEVVDLAGLGLEPGTAIDLTHTY